MATTRDNGYVYDKPVKKKNCIGSGVPVTRLGAPVTRYEAPVTRLQHLVNSTPRNRVLAAMDQRTGKNLVTLGPQGCRALELSPSLFRPTLTTDYIMLLTVSKVTDPCLLTEKLMFVLAGRYSSFSFGFTGYFSQLLQIRPVSKRKILWLLE